MMNNDNERILKEITEKVEFLRSVPQKEDELKKFKENYLIIYQNKLNKLEKIRNLMEIDKLDKSKKMSEDEYKNWIIKEFSVEYENALNEVLKIKKKVVLLDIKLNDAIIDKIKFLESIVYS